MASALGSILRAAARQPDEPLNILTFPTHERYESALARTGHVFWAVRTEGIKDWNRTYSPLPDNYHLLDPTLKDAQIPADIDFDLVLSQNKFGQYQIARRLADALHLPLVSLEHTLPVPGWPESRLQLLRTMRGDIDVFIAEYSRAAWGWGEEAAVIHHGIDTEVFRPVSGLERAPHFLSVVNDWINRDWACGYRFWQEALIGLPVRVLGDTPGLSRPARTLRELAREYASARFFVNTSLVSPVPTALLEAMASGCAVISTATCMIPEIITHDRDGLLATTPEELRRHCRALLTDPERARRLGEAARETIRERFGLARFVAEWDVLLRRASDRVYTGSGRGSM
jgi:glycosyltransferase involved in cell wall biosynthesis